MANLEHLKILEQGVKAWNKWREENPDIMPNFKEADLRDASLSKANLSKSDFSFARLRGSNLCEANLERAHLIFTDLKGVNLRNASLPDANILTASLQSADLRGSFLARANFTDVDFSGVDLRSAYLVGNVFANVNLSNVKNLEKCTHHGPSFIDYQTLMKSGNLPKVFLRGCGLPDSLIEYYPSLLNQAIQRYSCFISYSSQDDEFAKRLHADLQDNGVRCWFAPEDLKIGDKIRFGIDEAIRVHDKLLLILSENSIDSQWVEQEVEKALEKERDEDSLVLFPIRIDDSVFDTKAGWAPYVKNSRNIGDFSNWKNHDSYQKAFKWLLRDLKGEI